MPVHYLAALTAPTRTARANLHLGVTLCFVAGALNAGGFLAIGQYTSHMTGMVSLAADHLVLGNLLLAAAALVSLVAFVAGAASTAVMVNHGKRHGSRNLFAPPLLLEAALILVFGVFGAPLQSHSLVTVSFTAIGLCFTMGLQNALITKISNAEIRTTHVTGLVTDLGIELGKLFYWNRQGFGSPDLPMVRVNRGRLRVHAALIGAFFGGGVIGALGFKYIGFLSAAPLAMALVLLALAPALQRTAKIG